MKYTVNSLILITAILFAGHARAEQGFIGLKDMLLVFGLLSLFSLFSLCSVSF